MPASKFSIVHCYFELGFNFFQGGGPMKRIRVCLILILILLLSGNLFSQVKPSPSLSGQGVFDNPSSGFYVIYDQMNYPGTNSISSQNFEVGLDNYDSFAADDFALMDMTWYIESIDVLGVYINGSGPANSVNVWIYLCDGSGGLPTDTIYSALNIVPSAGLADGSFSIPLPVTAVLNEGWYWLCVQANMDMTAGGQWLWTERTLQDFSESAWENPGGGLGTPCTPSWGYRVTNCGIGSQPDNCFRLNGFVTPVELTSFTATANGNEVILNWSTATETNNQEFEIYKKKSGISSQETEWEKIGFVPGFGTTTEPKSYTYIDSKVTIGKYAYHLKQIDFDGSFEYSPEVEIEFSALFEYALEQNSPNPFNPTTIIKYSIPKTSLIKLTIFDLLGREIHILVNEEKSAGDYEIEFNASNLPSGVYFYRLQAGDFTETKKMLLLK